MLFRAGVRGTELVPDSFSKLLIPTGIEAVLMDYGMMMRGSQAMIIVAAGPTESLLRGLARTDADAEASMLAGEQQVRPRSAEG